MLKIGSMNKAGCFDKPVHSWLSLIFFLEKYFFVFQDEKLKFLASVKNKFRETSHFNSIEQLIEKIKIEIV